MTQYRKRGGGFPFFPSLKCKNSIRLALRCSLVSCGTFAGGRRYKLCFPRSRIFCQSSITAEACAVPVTVVPVPVPVPVAVTAAVTYLFTYILTYVLLFVTVPPVHYGTVKLGFGQFGFHRNRNTRSFSVLLGRGPPSPRLLFLSFSLSFSLYRTHSLTHSLLSAVSSPIGSSLSSIGTENPVSPSVRRPLRPRLLLFLGSPPPHLLPAQLLLSLRFVAFYCSLVPSITVTPPPPHFCVVAAAGAGLVLVLLPLPAAATCYYHLLLLIPTYLSTYLPSACQLVIPPPKFPTPPPPTPLPPLPPPHFDHAQLAKTML